MSKTSTINIQIVAVYIMLINEDFFDEQDIDVGVSSVNIDIESENYMMQNKRPVE